MPFSVRADARTDVVRVHLTGSITSPDVVEAVAEVRRCALARAGAPQLWQALDVEEARIHPALLRVLHLFTEARRAYDLPVRGKRAVVTRRADLTLFADLCNDELGDVGLDIRVFEDEESAMAWLRE